MEDPGNCVVSTRAVKAQPRDASMAGESEVLRYLYMCYERLQNIGSNKQVGFYSCYSMYRIPGPKVIKPFFHAQLS